MGKTKRKLKVRISEHRSTIRCKNSTVATHFLEENHSISSLRYIGIEHVTLPRRGGDLDNLLLKREVAWVFNLKSLYPDEDSLPVETLDINIFASELECVALLNF